MRISGFEYHAPADLREALEILDYWGPEAKPLAGGTDLLLRMKHGLRPRCLVWLGNLEELKGVAWSRNQVRLGAMSLHADLAEDSEMQSRLPILARAVSLIGSWQIRNTATLGGNLGNASPAADSAGALAGPGGLGDPGRAKGGTGAAPGLVLPGSGRDRAPGRGNCSRRWWRPCPRVPRPGAYLKLMRKKAVDLALMSVAVQASLDEGGPFLKSLTLGLGGVAPHPPSGPARPSRPWPD